MFPWHSLFHHNAILLPLGNSVNMFMQKTWYQSPDWWFWVSYFIHVPFFILYSIPSIHPQTMNSSSNSDNNNKPFPWLHNISPPVNSSFTNHTNISITIAPFKNLYLKTTINKNPYHPQMSLKCVPAVFILLMEMNVLMYKKFHTRFWW